MKSKKKVIIAVCSILIVLLMIFSCMMIVSDPPTSMGHIVFTGEVKVEDGVPSPARETKEFIVEEDGKYYWIYDWMGEPGMITGMSVKDAEGISVFACTAEGCYAESEPMEVKAGTYEIEIVYLTKDEDMRRFLTDNGITEIGTETYLYAENGSWSTEYTIGLESASATSLLFKIALIVGVVIGLLVVVIILAVTKTGDDTKNQFDERQELVRGKGFQYGFFAIMISNAVLLFMKAFEISLFSDLQVAMALSIVIGISVFACYCIWNDGYFALNEKRTGLLISFGCCGLLNVLITIGHIKDGAIIENGAFTFRSTNLFCALLFFVIFIALLAKHIKDGKEE